MGIYVAVTPLNHNKTVYNPGDPVELDDHIANPLLRDGTIETVESYEAAVAADKAAKLARESRERVKAPQPAAHAAKGTPVEKTKADDKNAIKGTEENEDTKDDADAKDKGDADADNL